MEAPTGVSLGAMGSLLRKLDALLAPGCRLPKGVKDGMHLLKDDLKEVSAYLEDLVEVEDPPLTAKCWMKSVRELSYDIEDYIDKFPRPVHASIKTTRFVCKISRLKNLRIPKRLKWHQQIVNMVSEFRMYVQEAIERHERYELLDCGTSRRRFVSVGPMLPTPYEETADLVIDGRMSEFVNSLANDGDQQLKVVSVLGPGCLGKTTLARVLYHNLGGQFNCRAFVRVSRKPDMKRLFRDVLAQLQQQQPPDDCKELDLIDNIRMHLQDKRYLIVLDDLWAASVWDIINHAFPEGTRGSRIITTTQIEDVALTCCYYHSEYVFEMKPLDDYHSRKLFFNRLFGSRSVCPQQFKEVSNEIVGICGGLPLATMNIASLLASQPVILMDLLTYIRDSLSSYLWTNSTSEQMRQVLNLSYNNLPHYLKTCLLYLSMYPEGCTICKDDLVKQWLAEGFIDTTEGRDMEKVAGSYFDELIDRRFIQPIGINYNDEALSCTVHDMVHDLIAYKSAEENFIMVVDYYRKNVALSEKVRRLSVHFGDARYAKTPANIRMSQVRSLTFFGLSLCVPSIAEFKSLRILNLQLSGHRGDDTLDLTGISGLFQLRYLKITCDVCIELPNHMRGLQYLETLHLDTKVSAVPWDIIHLPCLLYLHLPVETNLSDWIGSTKSISQRSLGKLNDLRDLHLTCSTPPSDLLDRNMKALGSLLGGLGNLKTLVLVPGSSHKKYVVCGGSEVTVPWDGLAPPLLLQRFEWLPRGCIFSRVPKWIGELGNLRILKIAVRELLMNGIDILRGLPTLYALSLYVQTVLDQRIVFDKAGFSVLEYFKFRCSVPRLKFEVDAMPNLRKLKLGFNASGVDQHGSAHISIEHLSGLKEISVKIGGAGGDAESALTTTVSNHRSNPRIKVQLVDYLFYGDKSKSMGTNEKEHRTPVQQYEILEEDPGKFYRTQAEDKEEHENKQADSRIAVLSEFPSRLPVAGTRSTRVASALSKAQLQDGYVTYPWEKKIRDSLWMPNSSCYDSLRMPNSSCYLSMLVLPKALDLNACRYESFGDTLARANAWLYSSWASGIPIVFMNVQSEALLTKISGETASVTVNSGSLTDLSNGTNATLYGFEDYHGVDIGVVKAARLWYSSTAGEMLLEIQLQEGDTRLGFAISRTEEGFIYISSVVDDNKDTEAPSTRSGLRDLFNRAKEASKLLIISRVSNEKVLPWMISSSGAVRCYDTVSLSQKLSLHRRALHPIQLHLLMWEKAYGPHVEDLSFSETAPTIGASQEPGNIIESIEPRVDVEEDYVGGPSFRFDDLSMSSTLVWV